MAQWRILLFIVVSVFISLFLLLHLSGVNVIIDYACWSYCDCCWVFS